MKRMRFSEWCVKYRENLGLKLSYIAEGLRAHSDGEIACPPASPDEKPEQPLVFQIRDQNDLRKLKAFEAKHWKTCGQHDAVGAFLSYRILPTGMGDIVTAVCLCGAELTLYGDC